VLTLLARGSNSDGSWDLPRCNPRQTRSPSTRQYDFRVSGQSGFRAFGEPLALLPIGHDLRRSEAHSDLCSQVFNDDQWRMVERAFAKEIELHGCGFKP
jgi:hypothetical protein